MSFQRDKYLPLKRHQRRQSGRHKHAVYVAERRLMLEQLEDRVVLATTSVSPVADGFTQDNGPNGIVDLVVTATVDLQTQNISAANKELRSELEFDLSGIVISPSETITSARLEVQTTGVLFSPDITIYGYTGDGIITAVDHSETNTQVGFEQNPLIFAATEFDLALSSISCQS